jgi:ferrous iron transport protein A
MLTKSLNTEVTTLRNVPVGSSVRVTAVNGESRISRRLMEMGVIPGVSVEVIKTAPFGDPIEVRVRGYSLAMRKNEADSIEVSFSKS